jgi:hypothetical protein
MSKITKKQSTPVVGEKPYGKSQLKPGKYLVSVKLKLSQSVPGGTVPFEITTEPLGFTEETIQASQTNQ